MKRFGLIFVATGALIGQPAHPSEARSRPVCGPKAARTVVATERLRIFRRDTDEVVCSRYSRRRWSLDPRPDQDQCDYSSQGCDGRTHLAVAGRWVLQVTQHLGGGSGSDGTLTLRAAGARIARTTYAFEAWRTSIVTARLDSRGAVAWIERPDGPDPFRVIRGGHCDPETLDHGQNIDARSLRIVGGVIRWNNGSDQKSAPACPVDDAR